MKKKRIIIPLVLIVVTLAVVISIGFIRRQIYPIKYMEFVAPLSEENNIPIELIFAIIRTESGFKPSAESHLNARGLMQIREETFEWIQLRRNYYEDDYGDLYDPETNIRYGTWLLRILTDDFGSYENAIIAYHAGWGSLTNWLDDEEFSKDKQNINKIPYADTAHYLYKVEKAWEEYETLYDLKG